MENFQSVETLLEAWKALHPRSKLGETINEPAFYEGGIVILEKALELLKRPPNQAIATDACGCPKFKPFGTCPDMTFDKRCDFPRR